METNKITITPSQWVNTGWFLLFLVSMGIGMFLDIEWIMIPFGALFLYKFATIQCHRYYFDEDSEVLVERKGVFSVQTVEIHYFRIKSVQIQKPFLMRLVGISTVQVITSEPFKPFLTLYAVSHGNEWVEFLQDMGTYWRNEKGVKETDFHSF